MKKLSKNQKLIGFIAILLVTVIIAIVITTSIIKNNNQVANEGYAATTANAGSSLISNYILNGITIGGITGKMDVLNTNDATARPEDIALGKTAYVKGEKITGTRMDIGTVIDESTELNVKDIYYADLDDDGTVDGVIFADLAVGESDKWGTNGWGTYTIPKEENLKSYYIKSENYTDDSFKKTGKVIAPIEANDESKNDRFYVMTLDDFDSSLHYWYYKAYGNLDSSYNVSVEGNDFAAKGAEPTGRINTERMIASWNSSQYGAQNSNDMWGVIQQKDADGKSKIEKGWFVPSKSEWAAFGAAFGITSSNYSSTFGLSDYYWSSTQYDTGTDYYASFYRGHIYGNTVSSRNYVRLATTF